MPQSVDPGAAGGLVPSINNVKTLEIDSLRARCTRLRKNLGVAAKWLSQSGGQAFMVTLTYRGTNADWRPSHIRDCLRHVRQWCSRSGYGRLRYLWVIETKPRLSGEHIGEVAPHYHVVIWLPKGVACPHWDRMGWWEHGMTNTVQAVAPVRYVMKYVSKFDSRESFPKGARCYGVGGIDETGARCRRWINWPSFVQARASVADTWRRAKGGGWVDCGSGEWWPSEWGLSAVGRTCTRLVRLCSHSRPLEPVGPFSWSGVAV